MQYGDQEPALMGLLLVEKTSTSNHKTNVQMLCDRCDRGRAHSSLSSKSMVAGETWHGPGGLSQGGGSNEIDRWEGSLR